MAMREPTNDYGTYGSVPDVAPSGTITTRATPDAFGANVGAALQQGGQEIRQGLGQDTVATAIKLQGMVNETTATNAESQYLAERGKLDGDFKSLNGQNAYAALPKYVSDLQALRAKYRPGGADGIGGAARAYDLATIRAEGYSLNDANMWAASQVKSANKDAALNSVSAYQAVAAQTGTDDTGEKQFREALGHIKYQTQATLHEGNPGVIADANGGFTFSADAQGQQAKVGYQAALDANIGKAWQNRISTMALTDPIGAGHYYLQNKSEIPAFSQSHIEAELQPQIIQAYARGGVHKIWNETLQDYHDFVSGKTDDDPSRPIADAIHGQESRGRANSPTSIDGAVGGWQITPKTWDTWKREGLVHDGEVITDPKDNETVARRAIAKFSKDYTDDDGKPDAARVAVAYFSGPGNVSPKGSAQPFLADNKDGNGELVSSYVSDVTGRLGQSGQQTPATSNISAGSNFPRNPDGSRISTADYFSTHREEVLAKADQYAEQMYPGDAQFRAQMRERFTNQMNAAIADQSAAYKQDNTQIQRGIVGELSNGKPPKTYDELYAIPGMAAVLNRAAVHSPQFYATIDKQLERYNKVAHDTQDFGTSWDKVKNDIADHKINSVSDLAPYIHDNTLTARGVDQAMKWMKDMDKEPEAVETKKLALDALKGRIWPFKTDTIGQNNWVRAQPAAEKAFDKGLAEVEAGKYAIDDLLNPASDKWFGKGVMQQFGRTPSQTTADMHTQNQAAGGFLPPGRDAHELARATFKQQYQAAKTEDERNRILAQMTASGLFAPEPETVPKAPETK